MTEFINNTRYYCSFLVHCGLTRWRRWRHTCPSLCTQLIDTHTSEDFLTLYIMGWAVTWMGLLCFEGTVTCLSMLSVSVKTGWKLMIPNSQRAKQSLHYRPFSSWKKKKQTSGQSTWILRVRLTPHSSCMHTPPQPRPHNPQGPILTTATGKHA